MMRIMCFLLAFLMIFTGIRSMVSDTTGQPFYAVYFRDILQIAQMYDYRLVFRDFNQFWSDLSSLTGWSFSKVPIARPGPGGDPDKGTSGGFGGNWHSVYDDVIARYNDGFYWDSDLGFFENIGLWFQWFAAVVGTVFSLIKVVVEGFTNWLYNGVSFLVTLFAYLCGFISFA